MNDMPADLHKFAAFLHVFAAIAFMGNIMVSATWMAAAKRTRDKAVLHFAARAVVRADRLFTLPGVIIILATGLITMGAWGGFGGAHWAEMGLALFILASVIWLAVLLPLQRRMLNSTGEAVDLGIGLSEDFYSAQKRWSMWSGIATLLLMIALYLMVFKPDLWS